MEFGLLHYEHTRYGMEMARKGKEKRVLFEYPKLLCFFVYRRDGWGE